MKRDFITQCCVPFQRKYALKKAVQILNKIDSCDNNLSILISIKFLDTPCCKFTDDMYKFTW